MPARLGHHRRRSGAARSWRHHKLFGSAKEVKGNSTKIVLVALDLLYLNGYELAANVLRPKGRMVLWSDGLLGCQGVLIGDA
jgi:hypothetical protein